MCQTDKPEVVLLRQVPLVSIEDKILSCWLSRKPDKFWDVVLVFDDETELLCSRRDLSLMSEYFATMFESEFVDSAQGKVSMREIQRSVMTILVEAYYTKKVSTPSTCVGHGGPVGCTLAGKSWGLALRRIPSASAS